MQRESNNNRREAVFTRPKIHAGPGCTEDASAGHTKVPHKQTASVIEPAVAYP